MMYTTFKNVLRNASLTQIWHFGQLIDAFQGIWDIDRANNIDAHFCRSLE